MAYSSSDEKDTQDFSFLESEGLPNYFFETQTGNFSSSIDSLAQATGSWIHDESSNRAQEPIETYLYAGQQDSNRIVDDDLGMIDFNEIFEEDKIKNMIEDQINKIILQEDTAKSSLEETTPEDLAKIKEIAEGLKSAVNIPHISPHEIDPIPTFTLEETDLLDLLIIRKKGPGRPKNSATNTNQNFIKVGTKKVEKGGPEHKAHLERTRVNVQKWRRKMQSERKVKRLDDDVKCKYCGGYYKKNGVKTHEEKCPAISVMTQCEICGDYFKKIGIKNHKKTCEKMSSSVNPVSQAQTQDSSSSLDAILSPISSINLDLSSINVVDVSLLD